jgi:hypothetical protein
MRNNATIYAKNIINIDAAVQDELRDIEDALDQAFRRYDVPYSWILATAELLRKYETLSGKKYKPNQEDSII